MPATTVQQPDRGAVVTLANANRAQTEGQTIGQQIDEIAAAYGFSTASNAPGGKLN